jgi:hypothetical protein
LVVVTNGLLVAVDQLAGIITDSGAPASEVATWRAAGMNVITADPGAA